MPLLLARIPKSGVVVVTKGLLDLLDRLELEGVIAHEISHIKNYDVRLQTVAAVMVGLIVILGDSLKRSFYYSRRRRDKDRKYLRNSFFSDCNFSTLSCHTIKICPFETKRIYGRC